MNRLETVLERPEPTMAVVFTQPLAPGDGSYGMQAITRYADVAELRADKYPRQEPRWLAEQIHTLGALPLLLTIRYQGEGGGWTDTEAARLALFNELLPLPHVDGVDIELMSPIAKKVIHKAHELGKIAIVSNHNFSDTPNLSTLERRFKAAQDLNADYVKFATSARSQDEFERLCEFTIRHSGDKIITVAMDDYGPLSRITLPGLGSHMIYAFPGTEAVAPGQLGYLQTHNYLKSFYPGYAALFTTANQ